MLGKILAAYELDTVEDRINNTYIYQAVTISTITSLLNSILEVINVLGSHDGR
jgi:hypothetical protein